MFITVACPEKSRKKMILILYILYQKKEKIFKANVKIGLISGKICFY